MQQFFKNAFKKRRQPPGKLFALVSADVDVSFIAHVQSLCLLLVVICAGLSMVCELLSLCLEGIPIKIWHAFLQSWPQVLLVLIGRPASGTYSQRVNAVYLWITLWLFLIFLCWLIRRFARDFQGLRKAARAQTPGEPTVNVSEYMRVSPASWLYPQLIDAPSPTALLDLLQQGQDWSQHIAEVLQNAPEEKRPPITILISLSDHLTISIMSQDGKQETMQFKNNSWVAILAFFALHNKGEWIPRDTVVKHVYGAENGHLLALHTSRINAQVNQVAEDAGFLDEQAFEETGGKLDLFEQDESDPRHLWRLSPRCEVEIFSDLTSLYEQVLVAQTGQVPLHRDALRGRCHQILERYGKGLLAEHQEKHRIWSWLRDAYITYRDQLLCILEYAASCEWQVAQAQAHSDIEECQEATWYSARFSGRSSLIALGIVSRPDAGEPSLLRCLERYYLLKDIDAAGSIYQAYAERMLERDSRWTPRLKILETWPEVTRWQSKKKQSQKDW